MKVFIVEDAAIMLENLQSILSDIPGVTVIGHAADEEIAIGHIGMLLPDFVILDISMRNGAGLDILKSIKKRHSGIKVIALAGSTEEFYLERCKRAGADYFFDKAFQLTRIRAVLWQWVNASRWGNGLEGFTGTRAGVSCHNPVAAGLEVA